MPCHKLGQQSFHVAVNFETCSCVAGVSYSTWCSGVQAKTPEGKISTQVTVIEGLMEMLECKLAKTGTHCLDSLRMFISKVITFSEIINK